MTRFLLVLILLAGCETSVTTPSRTPGGRGGVRLMDAGAQPAIDAATDRGTTPGEKPVDAMTPRSDASMAPPDAPAAGPMISAAEEDLLRALNDERRAYGLPPVTIDEELLCAARKHAMDVGGNGSCGHVGSDGTWPWDRAMACGFPQESWTVNEIAAGPGFSDGADAVSGWQQSPGHHAAIVHERATKVGVGIVNSCYIALFDCCVAGSE